MFGTTPGGTRIIYERSFLLECRNSPLAQSPLANLPRIPGVTYPAEKGSPSPKSIKPPSGLVAERHEPDQTENKKPAKSEPSTGVAGDDPQFEMDI